MNCRYLIAVYCYAYLETSLYSLKTKVEIYYIRRDFRIAGRRKGTYDTAQFRQPSVDKETSYRQKRKKFTINGTVPDGPRYYWVEF